MSGDAKPMSKDQLRHRREQGRKLHEEAVSGPHGAWLPEDIVALFQRGFETLQFISPPCEHHTRPTSGFMIRRQAQ